MAIQIVAESLKSSIGRVSKVSYEPVCLRQVNPLTAIKFHFVKDHGTQSNSPSTFSKNPHSRIHSLTQRERKGERDTEREREKYERETWIDCLLYAPQLSIEPVS